MKNKPKIFFLVVPEDQILHLFILMLNFCYVILEVHWRVQNGVADKAVVKREELVPVINIVIELHRADIFQIIVT